MNRLANRTAALALAAVLVSVAACSSASTQSGSSGAGASGAKGTFQVLLVTSLSGSLAVAGAGYEHAVEAAAAVFNAKGGADGSHIVVTTVDDAGNPTQAVTALQQAEQGKNYNLIIPGTSSDEATPLLPLLEKTDSLQISVSLDASFNDPAKYPEYFSSSPPFSAQADAILAEVKAKGYKHIVSVAADTASSKTSISAYAADAKAMGLQFNSVFVPSDAVDATPQLQQAQATGADVMLMSGYDPSFAPILKARGKLGITTPTYADLSFAANAFQTAGITGSGSFGCAVRSAAIHRPR